MEYNIKLIRKEIIILMIPLIVESFLQICTNFVATAMVGRLEPIDVSSQGMSTKITDIVYYFFRGTGTAMVVLIARYNAKDEIKKCRHIFHKTVQSMIVLGSCGSILIIIVPELLLGCFTADDLLIEYAVPYLRIIAYGLPFWTVMIGVTSVFQGVGDTKTPMFLALYINIVNLLLCWILIFGHFGAPQLGVLGAAVSLTVSRIIGCIAGIYLIFHKKFGIFNYNQKGECVENVLTEVYSIGIPAAGEAIIWQFSSILLSRIILSYGSDVFAAYQLGVQAEYITEIPAIGFSVASISLISKAIALEDKKLFFAYKQETIQICVIISIFTTLLLTLLPGQFMRLLTNHDLLIMIGKNYVFVMGLIQIPQNLIKIYAGIFRSTGEKYVPILIEFVGLWGFRIPAILLCTYSFHLPLVFVWICIGIDQIGKFLFSFYYTKKRKYEFCRKSNVDDKK